MGDEGTTEVISTQDEQEFWGIHEFQETLDSIRCGRCGWGFHDPIHEKSEEMSR